MIKEEFEGAKKLLEENGYSFNAFIAYIAEDLHDKILKENEEKLAIYRSNDKYRQMVLSEIGKYSFNLDDWKRLSNEELIFLCTKLDLSNSQVARMFGITPNSVSGRYRKLGYSKSQVFGSHKVTEQEVEEFLENFKAKYGVANQSRG